MLNWLRQMFRPKWKPENWLVRSGEQDLFRWEYQEWTENASWLIYRVVFLGGSPELLQGSLGLTSDPTELEWELVDCATGRAFPIRHFWIIAKDDGEHVQLKYMGPH